MTIRMISADQAARFKKLPGFLTLTSDGDSFVCKIAIAGQRRRIGAQTLDVLYNDITTKLRRVNENSEAKTNKAENAFLRE